MYIKEIEDKETQDMLEKGSCMNCGLLPLYVSELDSDGVVVSISFNDNLGWTFKVDAEKQKMTDCYCPICTRKMKLLKLKKRYEKARTFFTEIR